MATYSGSFQTYSSFPISGWIAREVREFPLLAWFVFTQRNIGASLQTTWECSLCMSVTQEDWKYRRKILCLYIYIIYCCYLLPHKRLQFVCARVCSCNCSSTLTWGNHDNRSPHDALYAQNKLFVSIKLFTLLVSMNLTSGFIPTSPLLFSSLLHTNSLDWLDVLSCDLVALKVPIFWSTCSNSCQWTRYVPDDCVSMGVRSCRRMCSWADYCSSVPLISRTPTVTLCLQTCIKYTHCYAEDTQQHQITSTRSRAPRPSTQVQVWPLIGTNLGTCGLKDQKLRPMDSYLLY